MLAGAHQPRRRDFTFEARVEDLLDESEDLVLQFSSHAASTDEGSWLLTVDVTSHIAGEHFCDRGGEQVRDDVVMEHPALDELVADLASCGWVSDLWLHGSLATGDHSPGVSDLDLVAITTRPLEASQLRVVKQVHRHLDTTWPGSAVGCAYVDASRLDDGRAEHPTWTHGRLIRRRLSAMVRAELLDHGRPLVGRPPSAVLDPMSPAEVADAVREELTGYWSWAARRPWLFLHTNQADLALLSMARARITLDTGELATKTEALARVRAPRRVVAGLRRRRSGEARAVPFAPVLAHHAWHDTRRTIADQARPG